MTKTPATNLFFIGTLLIGLLPALGCATDDFSSSAHPIIGGSATADFEGVPNFGSGCSGVLISPRVLLTVATCLDPEALPTEVYFGTTRTGVDTGELGTVAVESTATHPDWDGSLSGTNPDLGLILLAEVAPAPFMAMDRAGRVEGDVGAAVTIVGWGVLDYEGTGTGAGVKRSGATTIADVESVIIQFGDTSVTTCFGDGGGPVVMNVDGTPTVIALSSFNTVDCSGPSGGPQVNPALTSFIDPFVAANDPDAPDPDVDDPIVDDGDDGGCAVSTPSSGLPLYLVLAALFFVRRRRRSRS